MEFIMITVDFRRNRMDNQNNNNKPRNNRQGWSVIIITTLLAIFVVMGLYSLMQDKLIKLRSVHQEFILH